MIPLKPIQEEKVWLRRHRATRRGVIVADPVCKFFDQKDCLKASSPKTLDFVPLLPEDRPAWLLGEALPDSGDAGDVSDFEAPSEA